MVGRVDEQEPQVPPAVAEARELRLAAARVVLDRELADVELLLRGPDHHLGGELHPGRAQVEPRQHVAAQRAHPAVGVVDAGAEQQVQEAGQQRVADVAVVPRHRARVDVLHPVADHDVGAVVELGDEPRDLVEVVGQVGVDHHDVAAAGGGEAGQVGAAVAAPRLDHDAARRRACASAAAAVRRAVVDDDDLALEPAAFQRPCARRTHSSIVSASFRHGITTETRQQRPGFSGRAPSRVCRSIVLIARRLVADTCSDVARTRKSRRSAWRS